MAPPSSALDALRVYLLRVGRGGGSDGTDVAELSVAGLDTVDWSGSVGACIDAAFLGAVAQDGSAIADLARLESVAAGIAAPPALALAPAARAALGRGA